MGKEEGRFLPDFRSRLEVGVSSPKKMKKIKDPNTGVIKYIRDENDIILYKLNDEIKKVNLRLKDLENRINKLEKGDI